MNPPLDPGTVLRCATGVHLEYRGPTAIRLRLGGRTLPGTPYTLAVLDAFVTERTLADAFEALRARATGARSWIELTAHVLALYRFGVLETPGAAPPAVGTHPTRFDSAPVHIRMLDDHARTEAYQRAIRAVVRPGDVVVDIGTGTGILAATAARAGAARVYALEVAPIGELARRLFAANDLADRVTLVPGWSTRTTLPERADVVLSEIVGDDPLNEGILPVMADAARRFLKPGGRLVPSTLRLYALPLAVPEAMRERWVFTEGAAARWAARYGLDFGVLAAAHRAGAVPIKPWKARSWTRLSPPVPLASFDLHTARASSFETTRSVTATRAGTISGVLLYFEMDLGPEVFSTHPDRATPETSWRSVLWLPETPVTVAAGQGIDLRYRYGAEGSQFECLTDVRAAHPGV